MDQFRHENLTPDMVNKATRAMMDMGINPRDILTNPETFNAYPIEVRSKFFERVGGSPVIQVSGVGGPPDPVMDIFDDRIRNAPKTPSAPTDVNQIFSSRIQELDTRQKQQAQAAEASRQAEVPTMGPMGLVRDQPAPRKSRSIKDYLVGAGEAALTTATGAIAAPIAAYEELAARALGSKQPKEKVFKERMESMTFAPRTEVGQEAVAGLGQIFGALPAAPAPELVALGRVRTAPIVSPRALPGYVAQTGQEVAAATKAIPGDVKAATAPALEGIGMRSVGAAGRADQTRFEAAVNALPEAYRAQARELGWKKGNPAVIEAHAEALNLPVPVQLTAGQATGDIIALSREYNQRGKNPELAYRFNEQNRALVENLDALRDMAAPDVFDTRPVAIGNTLKNAYQQLDNQLTADIDAKYTALRDAAGGQFPVDVKALYGNSEKALKKNLLFRLAEKDLPEFRELKDLAESGAMDFETYQNLRRNLGTTARTSSDGNVRMAASLLIDELEKLPLSKQAAGLKSLADEARSAARNRFERIKADPAYKAAIDNKVADERFADTFLFGARGTQAQLKQMIQNLGEDQKQVLAAAVVQRIRDKAVNANGDFSPAAYAKEFKAMEPKLLDIFPGETVQTMRVLGDVAKRVKSSPSGSFFNRSGTLVGALAEQAAGAAEQGINLTVMSKTGIPVPVATLGREKLSARKAAKETEKTLEPLAGAKTKLKDIGKD
jgi:hypothetical protein